MGFYRSKNGPFKFAPVFDSVTIHTNEGQVLCAMNNVFEDSVGIILQSTKGNIVWPKIIRHIHNHYIKYIECM